MENKSEKQKRRERSQGRACAPLKEREREQEFPLFSTSPLSHAHARRPPFFLEHLVSSFPPPPSRPHFPSLLPSAELVARVQRTQAPLGVGRPGVDVLVVRLDDRPDRALVDEVADRGACQRAVDAQAVREDRGRDHLVLGDLLEELVVGGLRGSAGF